MGDAVKCVCVFLVWYLVGRIREQVDGVEDIVDAVDVAMVPNCLDGDGMNYFSQGRPHTSQGSLTQYPRPLCTL